MERTVLESRLEDVQLRVALKDLQLDLAGIRAENAQVKAAVSGFRFTGGGAPAGSGESGSGGGGTVQNCQVASSGAQLQLCEGAIVW